MNKEYLKKWAIAAGIRAIRTFAQVAAAGITTGAALGEVPWANIMSVAAVAAIYSILMAAAGIPEVPKEDEA